MALSLHKKFVQMASGVCTKSKEIILRNYEDKTFWDNPEGMLWRWRELNVIP
jgi:hypothetical protein